MNPTHTALLIPADSTLPVRCLDLGERGADYGSFIGCEWVNVIRTRYEDAQMIINDHGLMMGG